MPALCRQRFLSALFTVVFPASKTLPHTDWVLNKYLLNEWIKPGKWGSLRMTETKFPTTPAGRQPKVRCIKRWFLGLPWWCSGWESACQCRGHGFEPWSGKIPHAAEQLGPWATTTEPARLEPVLRNWRGHDGEKPTHRDEEWPPLAATRESPRTETKTQHSHK